MLGDRVDAEYLDAAGPQLKAVANYAVGYNNIDLAAAKSRGLQIGNTPDVLTEATADIAIGLMLAAGRLFGEATRQVRELGWRTWNPIGLLGVDFVGSTLGIIGMGRIGEAVTKRCHFGWDMKVIYTSRSPKPEIDAKYNAQRVSLEELLNQSDVVSVHVDLNAETKSLMNADRLKQMKPSAILINTSRGAVIDQDVLYDALKSKQLFAAGLDVTEPEPLPDDSRLRELSNCFILPHIGSATKKTRDAMSTRAAENILAALSGRAMPYPVNLG
jgi:lactate dehydrogenase-like 2-hydroxyacid dehydrogenase